MPKLHRPLALATALAVLSLWAGPSLARRAPSPDRAARLTHAFLTKRAPQIVDRMALSASDRASHIERQIGWATKLGDMNQARSLTKYRDRTLREVNAAPPRKAQLQRMAKIVAASPKAQKALASVLENRAVSQSLLTRVLSNPHLEPVANDFLPRLPRGAKLSGVHHALYRMGQAGTPANLRGARFEVEVAPKLPRIAAVSTDVLGNECDAVLAPGKNGRRTLVAIHTVSEATPEKMRSKLHRTISGELHELKVRTDGTRDPLTGKRFDALMLVGVPPGTRAPKTDWKAMEQQLGTNLTVVFANIETNRLRTVYAGSAPR